MQMCHLDLEQLNFLLILKFDIFEFLLEFSQQVMQTVLFCLECLFLFVDDLVKSFDFVGFLNTEEDNFLPLILQ